ncbi:MAG: uracil-DNA glycosylase [Burkholderiales bacterium]|nr:uracil-DNA glycosylase [Burkholderiales bacterium]
MNWSERQRRMLRLMGLQVWSRPEAGVTPERPHAGLATDVAVDGTTGHATERGSVPPRASVAPQPAPAPAAAPVAMDALVDGADDERSRRIRTLDWTALRAAVAQCQACELHRTRRQAVFGVGHERAHWMVVGEAPGEQEDLQGEPFVGPAGQLLDRMLAALSLTRAVDGPHPPSQRVFIANTLKCRPPRNRNPQPAEMQACEPFLMRQIALVQPRIILAMGRFAIQSLLRTDAPVGKLRGQVHRYQGVPLVVTYHPAYLLRNPADKSRAWDDLCLAAQVVEEAGDPE